VVVSGPRGNDHRTCAPDRIASWRDARTVRPQVETACFQARPKTGWPRLWHPFWVQGRVRVCPVVGPFTLTDHRLPAPNPPGWIVKTRSEPSPVARISRADSRSRSRRRQSALSALFEKSAPTDVGGYDCSDSWIRPGAGAACLAGNERRER